MRNKTEVMKIHPLIAFEHGIKHYYKYDSFAVVNYEDDSDLLLEGYINGEVEIVTDGYLALQKQIEKDRKDEILKYSIQEICKVIKEELRK